MNIPNEAVKAASRAISPYMDNELFNVSAVVRKTLESAAPHMLNGAKADALREVATRMEGIGYRGVSFLRKIADQMEAENATPHDSDVEDLVDLLIEAEKTADSPTVFTRWHHYAEFILGAGYRKETDQ